MKEIAATRKVKEQLSHHFRKKGTVDNLPEHLKRVNPAVIEECKNYAKQHKGR